MRTAQDVAQIWRQLFPRFRNASSTLQGQVREMIVHAILSGLVPTGAPMPPSRILARELGISRTSVTLAMQALVGRGFLVARPRSGLYVSYDALLAHAGSAPRGEAARNPLNWRRRIVARALAQQRNIVKPTNWQSYPYPFIYGQFDASLMPARDWRACVRQSLLPPAVKVWSQDLIDGESTLLLAQIQQRLLPSRGIVASADEILVTAGAQMATYLLANVLFDRKTVVGVEDPGYPDTRNNVSLRVGQVVALPVDQHGLKPTRRLAGCDYVFVTPSHQCPTTVTMPLERRQRLLEQAHRKDIVLFEDDHESELNFSGRPLPALKSLDTDGRVIYIGSLSKTLAHSLRLGFVVGPAELIRELRRLRRLIMRHAPGNTTHVTGLFIAQGFHDAFLRRLNTIYGARRAVLAEALGRHLPECRVTPSLGGSAAWIEGPPSLDADRLAPAALAQGVIIEPGSIFFDRPGPACRRHFRLGYSAITEAQIEPGIRQLAEVIRQTG